MILGTCGAPERLGVQPQPAVATINEESHLMPPGAKLIHCFFPYVKLLDASPSMFKRN